MSSVRSVSGPRLTQKARKAVAPRSSRLVVRAGAERVTQSKDDIIVSPSILASNFATLGADVRPFSSLFVQFRIVSLPCCFSLCGLTGDGSESWFGLEI